ncbi:hypothetical protein R1sor_017467 [Riccia sorocarpa]|uniref:Uncharacterized protein n=1 Tax=Riccia sorocarpa TaxID=122646 RepID=A0ABD3IAI6_9MARC
MLAVFQCRKLQLCSFRRRQFESNTIIINEHCIEAEPELQIPAPPTPPLDERAMIACSRRRRLEVQSECLAYMCNANGTLAFQ